VSAATTDKSPSSTDYRIGLGGWANAWKIAAAFGCLGLAGAGAGYVADAKRFAFSYLFAFVFVLTIGLGSMMFVLIQHLTSAGWSVTVRRTAEFLMSGMPMLAVLFVPVLLVSGHLFPWMHMDSGHGHEAALARTVHTPEVPAQSAVHAESTNSAEAEQTLIEEHEEAHLVSLKRPYLNTPFFLGRVAFYFLVWTLIALRLFGLSTRQDSTKDPSLTVSAQRMAPLAMIVTALTMTFAGFDWLMSLDPTWYSTIFGVWIFAGAIVCTHALITLITLGLRRSGHLGNAVTVEHFHDLGKLSFGFLVFWAYIGFSQFFLIWYASIPEETTFYHNRWGDGPWKAVSLLILFAHFVFPFLFMLSRNVKRRPGVLAIGVLTVVLMHVVEVYWIVMPNYVPSEGMQRGDVLAVSWVDLACLVGVAGAYFAWVFRQMTRHALIPVGDPRLPRSMAFENA